MDEPHGLYEAAGRRRGEQRFLIVLGLLGLALALILGAFFTGRAISEDDSSGAADTAAEQQVDGAKRIEAESLAEAALGGAAPKQQPNEQRKRDKPSAKSERNTGKLTGKPYRGPRAVVTPRVARASCRSADSVDAGGRKVSYSAMNTIDGRKTSAWRCDGNGKGETVRFHFKNKQRLVAVGLVPGYAKTDPFNGVDRYRENRRIKRVRWTFDRGRFIEQRFDHRPGNRSLQKIRIPAVKTDTVTVKIIGSTRASRNTVAISRAWFAVAR